MADTVTGPTILQENDARVVIKIVNQSDGTGGTTVFGDVSAMAKTVKAVLLITLYYKDFGFLVIQEMVEIHTHV